MPTMTLHVKSGNIDIRSFQTDPLELTLERKSENSIENNEKV
jgi:hypothetical protein